MDEAGMVPERPLPAVEEHTRPFWEALREHRLVLARCDDCGALSHPPELSCATCGSAARTWIEASGRATLWSWTVCHPPMLPWFAQHGTWVVGVAELEEGPRLIGSLEGVPTAELAEGMPLRVRFDDLDDEVTLVAFDRA